MTGPTARSEREDFIQALRDMADFFEVNPDVPNPIVRQDIWLFATDAESSKSEVAAVAHAMGRAEKEFSDDLFTLRKNFGKLLQLKMHAYRQNVCERVVVGTKVVPAAPEQFIPAQPERVEELVEWHCTPLLEAANV